MAATCFVSEKEIVTISVTNVRIAIWKCILSMQWMVLRSKANTRAIRLTRSWLFAERLCLFAMPVERCMMVSSSAANNYSIYCVHNVDSRKFNPVQTRLELIQLPDDEFDTFPSLEIRTYSQRNQIDDIGDEDSKRAIEILHKHPLILVGDEEEDHNYNYNYNYKKLVCDICMRTITIPYQFYRCTQEGCSFLAHKVCVQLLSIVKFVIPDGHGNEVVKARPCSHVDEWFFCSIYFCICCCLPSSAPCYNLSSPDGSFPVTIDLPCTAAPYIIKHSSHSQHILFRTSRLWMAFPISCCSRGSTRFDVYKCTMCNFYIHIRCALLPKKVSFRKFDQHPLHLITATGSDHDICEVCEEGIECKYWYYRCAKCDYSFHVNCIPSLGYLSKVKFGGKFSIPCHSHPLTLKRMLTFGRNERCGFCDQIIPGLVDQAAFSCSQCDYWIHFSCARLELIQLPDVEFDTFPSLEIRTYSQRNKADNIGDEDKKLAIEIFHKHPLVLASW
ncbi:hypothetical protein SASPL_149475 [Salvia splendens]|uniref:DC1 domain-containing protein n=1 Tax=Salvia splendens TaxID=180675 RepID=A0A8X8WB72_SALSN|nr:hypothetical protein SASPL_149475 [Salvia splendens]